MISNWQTFSSQAAYSTVLYNFFLTTETQNRQSPDYYAYLDSRGYLSIGVGFNLTTPSVRDAVFTALGLIESEFPQNSTLNNDENGYIANLNVAIATGDAHTFNALLVARSQDSALVAALGPPPTGLSTAAAFAAFNQIIRLWLMRSIDWPIRASMLARSNLLTTTRNSIQAVLATRS